MGSRRYRSWQTTDTGFVPRSTSYYSRLGQIDRNRHLAIEPSRSTYSSSYSSDNNYTSNLTYPSNYSYPSNQRYDFINGRYTTDTRYTPLRDYQSRSYHNSLNDLYAHTNKLQQDYRSMMDSYSRNREDYSVGLPVGYVPKYMGGRTPASERYGLNDRRYNSSHYDSESNYDYDMPQHDRARAHDYEGSSGDYMYHKDVSKGKYDAHGQGRHRDDMSPDSPSGHGRANRHEYESGHHDHDSRYDGDRHGSRDSRDRDCPESRDRYSDREGNRQVGGEHLREKGKYDSGIDSPESVPPQKVPTPEPSPEHCVYNEISAEEAQQDREQHEKEEGERLLCPQPLIATLTETIVEIEKTELSSPEGSTKSTEEAMKAAMDAEMSFSMETGNDSTTDRTEAVDIPLSLDSAETPLGVGAKVVQVGEETIVTETTEQIVTEVPAGDPVPSEVRLELEPVMPEGAEKIVAAPQQPPAPAPAEGAETMEISMKTAPAEDKPEDKGAVQPVSIKLNADDAKLTDELENKPKVETPVEPEHAELHDKKVKSPKPEAKSPKSTPKAAEEKPKTPEAKPKSPKSTPKAAEEKPKSPAAKPKETPKAAEEKPKTPEGKPKLPGKVGKVGKLNVGKFGGDKAKVPQGAPKKKRLY